MDLREKQRLSQIQAKVDLSWSATGSSLTRLRSVFVEDETHTFRRRVQKCPMDTPGKTTRREFHRAYRMVIGTTDWRWLVKRGSDPVCHE